MLQTLEIRWFGDRPTDEAAREWFESIGDPSHRRGEERSDHYVALPGVTDLGLKFRGDHGIEVKARLEAIGVVELRREGDPFAAGVVESWAKWSYPGTDYPGLPDSLGSLDTVEVRKRRGQYLFHLPPGGRAEMLDLRLEHSRVDRGMALELADVECQGRVVWSIGVEAIPGGPDLGSDMLAALVPLLAGCPYELTAEGSSGYPSWLAGSGPTRSS